MENMFCSQCQEAAKGTGCTIVGVCGKDADLSALQDLLVYVTKGIAIYRTALITKENECKKSADFIIESLFMTITNANFDDASFVKAITEGVEMRNKMKAKALELGIENELFNHDAATWELDNVNTLLEKASTIGVLSTENEDVRSLRELIQGGLKGIAAYVSHADKLNFDNNEIALFVDKALVATLQDLPVADLIALTLETGKFGVDAMVLLDNANTTSYGHPEITEVNIGVGNKPGILISGHDLKDIEELLRQTEGTGVDVYTHSEMLPAHYYPAFKKYSHFVGNYGNAWWKQDKEFVTFNGPILMTTNCITKPKDSYINRVYTTGSVGFTGVKHVADRAEGGEKDFSEIIEQAKKCDAPTQIEEGTIIGGFAHNQVKQLAPQILEAVNTGAVKNFVVMAGCDGRMKSRDYYTEFADELPQDSIVLTAGCAKFRYNKLDMGDIGGIPRVLDAGQCNDSYSLVVTALLLKDALGLESINDLPIHYNIAWYEQKAVIVLLALLHLGVKNIKLGPTLPAFLSPNVVNVLVDNFGISGINTVEADLKEFGLN
ncbi:MAG: hydroxylamine reductase [Ichthyobacteriaceae bacterium]|nr:hydroxylamine reductase [Ichthyobacteriaceae bacterium]